MNGRGVGEWGPDPKAAKVESCADKLELKDLEDALSNPERLLDKLVQHGPLAKRWALAASWPALKSFLPAAIQREDAEAALRQLSIVNLKKLVQANPKALLQSVLDSGGPPAMKFAVAWGMAQVRSAVEPELPPGVCWADLESVFQGMTVADIKKAAKDPMGSWLSPGSL